MILTYQTDKHDFYCEDPNIIKTGPFGQVPYGRLYNIVPTGSPAPTSGYFVPAYIMRIKGYNDLKVNTCFVEFFKTTWH